MKVIIFNKNWTLPDVDNNKDKLFVYADNYMRIGRKGQAIIRGKENTVGIATKRAPNKIDVAYLNDKDIEENKKKIDSDILNIKYRSISENRKITLSYNCYGNGLAMMPEKCPDTYHYLNKVLFNNFGFDNLIGKKINKIPGYNELRNAKYIHISKTNEDIISAANNSFFIESYLKEGLISWYDLILSGKKIAFTHKSDFNSGEFLILKFDNILNYLVVKVCQSFSLDQITHEQWCMYEGINTSFNFDNKDLYNQIHFEYICILDSNNQMILPGDLFPVVETKIEEPIVEDPIVESIEELVIEEPIEPIQVVKEIKKIMKEEDTKEDTKKDTKEDLIIELLKEIKIELKTNKKQSLWGKLFGK